MTDFFVDTYSDLYTGQPIVVVNTWTGAYSAPLTVTGTPRPGTASLPVPIASSDGNWLIACIGWRNPAAYPDMSMTVADNAHNWWDPVAAPDSLSSVLGLSQSSVWIAPAARAATEVYIAPSGYTPGFGVVILEVSGLGTVPPVTGAGTAYGNTVSSITPSVSLTSQTVLAVSAGVGDSAVSPPYTATAGWSTDGSVTASGASDHSTDIAVTAATQVYTTTSASLVWSVATGGVLYTADMAATVAYISLTGATPPSLPSPHWPATYFEIGPAGGFQTLPDDFTWAAASAVSLSLAITQGRQYELSQLSAGQGTITLDNPTGEIFPGITTGPYAGITSGTPVRLRTFWPGGAWQAQWNGNGTTAEPLISTGRIYTVAPGVEYSARAWVAASAASSPGVVIWISFYTSGGTLISTAASTAQTTSVTAELISVTATAPATAATASVSIVATGTPPAATIFSAAAAFRSGNPAYRELIIPPAITWTAGNNATVTELAAFTPDVNGPPSVTPWRIPFSGFIERLPQSWDANYRGKVEATIVDAWAGVNYIPLPILFTEILNDVPWAYWPLADPQGSTYAANFAQGNLLALQVESSKYGTTGYGQAFGANSSALLGTQGTLLLTAQGGFRSNSQAGMWQQTQPSGGPTFGLGYSLVALNGQFPLLTTGATFEFWFQANADLGAGYAQLLTLGTANATSPAITIMLDYLGNVYVNAGNPGTWWGASSVAVGTYNMTSKPIALFTLYATTSAFTLYIDGVAQVTNKTWSSVASPAPPDEYISFVLSSPLRFQSAYLTPQLNTVAAPGSFGHVGIWGFELSQPRVLTHYLAGINAMEGEYASFRIERLLQAGRATGRRIIEQESGSEVDAVVSCQDISGQPASQSISNITTDLVPGMFLVAPTGDLFNLSKQNAWNNTVLWTLGEYVWDGEIPYLPSDITYEFDPTRITNEIIFTQLDRQDIVTPQGDAATAQTASQAKYGTVSYQMTGYLDGDVTTPLNFGPGLTDLANWLAEINGTPHLRLSSVTVDASSYPPAWDFVLGVSPGDMVTVTRRPIGAPVISVTGRVSQTDRSFSYGYANQVSAKVVLIIDPAPEYLALTCDDPVRGQLNGTTNVLGW